MKNYSYIKLFSLLIGALFLLYTQSRVGYIATTPKSQETLGSQNVGSQAGGLPARTQAVADCAIVTMTMGVYNKQTGNIADGEKLLNYALAWGQTAIDVGATEGVSAEAVKAENKRLSASVASNMAAFMQTAPSKMESCVVRWSTYMRVNYRKNFVKNSLKQLKNTMRSSLYLQQVRHPKA